jgi:ABC-2 type transport system permease protein
MVALALALTAGVPITMAALGPLDWGPVMGGYFAAILLGAAYLGIGLLVSASTDNQLTAFLLSSVICGALFYVGEESFTRNLPASTATLFQQIGTGARFRSVARGVLDLGDLVYYATIVLSALVANACALEWRKG